MRYVPEISKGRRHVKGCSRALPSVDHRCENPITILYKLVYFDQSTLHAQLNHVRWVSESRCSSQKQVLVLSAFLLSYLPVSVPHNKKCPFELVFAVCSSLLKLFPCRGLVAINMGHSSD